MVIIVSDRMVMLATESHLITTQEEMVIIVSDRMVMLATEGHLMTT